MDAPPASTRTTRLAALRRARQRRAADDGLRGAVPAGNVCLKNGLSVFAGTTDDAFWIDLGAAFDTANFRTLGSGVPGVLTNVEDAAAQNFAGDIVSGYAVNTIAIEVPIEC